MQTASTERAYRGTFALVVVLFFTWGFLTALNDVLVADLRSIFHLSYRSATLVQFTFFSTCFVCSFPASRFVTRLGYKATMAIGLFTMSFAALCFVRAASIATFPSFLWALAAMASGSTALQTAAGPYVSLLGPEGSASSRFSLALGVNSLGAMLAPSFGAWLILRESASKTTQAADLRKPYLLIAVGLASLAAVVLFNRFPPVFNAASVNEHRDTRYVDLLRHPGLLFGVLAMFLYVGAEIAIGGLLINFLRQPDTSNLSLQRAAFLASLYSAGAMAGRFGGWIVLKFFRPTNVLIGAAGLALALVLIAVALSGPFASAALLTVGLCNSVMVPIIFTSAIAGLGPLTSKGSGLLVAALVGGAVVPIAQGALADRIGLHHSFLAPAFSYLVICIYGAASREQA
jgi:FHS family L-fucose permease-like MFS transporter